MAKLENEYEMRSRSGEELSSNRVWDLNNAIQSSNQGGEMALVKATRNTYPNMSELQGDFLPSLHIAS